MISARQPDGRKADPQTDPPDIVAELDRWLEDVRAARGTDPLFQDARDEIVRLREGLRSLTEHYHAADEDAPHYSRDECPLCAKIDKVLGQ